MANTTHYNLVKPDTTDFYDITVPNGNMDIIDSGLYNKVDKNNAITGATKCKVTYDAKGLVTAGADLSASDIPDLPASKITSGAIPDGRIASASTWNGKSNKSKVITGTLTVAGWSNNTQTLTFTSGTLPTTGYAYTLAPASADFTKYAEAMIYAEDVTTADTMVFHCSETPTSAINIVILRQEVTTWQFF